MQSPKQVEIRTPARPGAAYSQHYYSYPSAQRQANIEGKKTILPFQVKSCEHPSAEPKGDRNCFVCDGLAEGVCVCFLLFLGGLASILFLAGLPGLAHLALASISTSPPGGKFQVKIPSFFCYYSLLFFTKQSTISDTSLLASQLHGAALAVLSAVVPHATESSSHTSKAPRTTQLT